MPLPTGDTIGILGDNLRLRGSVLPISTRKATNWARSLNLSHGGETVLYTGQMYQLTPYIQSLVRTQERLGESRLARFTKLGRSLNRAVNLSAFMARPSAETRAQYDRILIDVAVLLQQAGIVFGYLYRDDLYSGALAYDLGLDEAVARHALRVYEALKRNGVKRVITVDPHTTNMLRSVYPRMIESYDIKVRSYLEVLADQEMTVGRPLEGSVALHDSCIYARSENVIQEPRSLLTRTGISVKEPVNAGRLTWCCGGPAESLYPEKALANAERRVAQLRETAPVGVTMCPLCLVNLRRGAGGSMLFQDISYYLRQAYATKT